MKRILWKTFDAQAGEGAGGNQKDFTPADLLKELNDMKTSLEAKAKDEAVKAADEKLKAINDAIEALKAAKADDKTADKLKEMRLDLDATIKAFDLLQTRVKAQGNVQPTKEKSFGEQLAEAITEKSDDFAKLARKEQKRVEIELKAVGAVSTSNVTGTTNWGAISRPGIIENPSTQRHVRSLLSVLPADAGTDYYFMREDGNGEGAPAPVAEGALKPQFDIDLREASVKFETIAGWMLITRKALNNVKGLTSFIQKRAPEKLLDVEDAQLLYGDGVSPNVKGILTAGNYVASTSAATVLVEKIIDDISLLEDTHKRAATGIAMRPAAYYSFFKNKATGSGEYDLPQGVQFINGVLYILGVPVAKTTALNAADYVVGDFVNGADLMIQEGMRLEFFEQDSDNVRKNLITMRIEETAALPVYGSNFFIKGAV